MIYSLLTPFKSYKYLLSQLIIKEIKARYKQSIIGYFWILLNPIFQLLIYLFVFSVIIKFPTGDIPYTIFLFVGLLPWVYFQTSLTACTLSLVDNSELLRKVAFPREVLPYSVIVARFVDLLFSSLILGILMLYYQMPLFPSIIYIIPILIIQIILMSGLALIFSASNLFYRDFQYLITLLLLVWFYLTPVIYPLSMVPQYLRFFYNLNPMVGIIISYRSALFNEPIEMSSLISSLAISLLIFIIGFIYFKKSEKVFADVV